MTKIAYFNYNENIKLSNILIKFSSRYERAKAFKSIE